jgi:DNA-binding beta-propeller fold protein YncE
MDIDLAARKVVNKVTQAYGKPGFPCPPNPVPHAAPHQSFGCFPDANGVTISPHGGGLVFTGNGGTDDVSAISLAKAIAGDPGAEIARIPVQTGPFGVSTSPDGKLVVVANRESARDDAEGNTISIIVVEKAAGDAAIAEVARLLVGTNNPATRTRPFAAAFTPDGQRIVVTNFRANNVSIVDLKKALANEPAEIARIALATPGGAPSRPRGIAFTPDGKYVAITGAPRGNPNSGVVWILDLATYKVAGRVTEIGNESYMIDTLVR